MGCARVRVGLLAALLIGSLYLPMLAARFDFVDDGDLVYPAAPMPLAARAALTWARVVDNWRDLGPFRPVLWAHWDLQAELFGGDALRWRLSRLLWTALATVALLWLFGELRIAPLPAALAAALVMWAPAPNEIWRSLTLSEGVAMPYAVAALACAVHAGRSPRPLWWEIGALAGTTAALGCKSTFVAIVPALVLLRVAPDGEPLAPALRARGARAALLALPALLPLLHLIAFLAAWHPGQYEPGWPSWEQLRALTSAVLTGSGALALLPGMLVASRDAAVPAAQWWSRRRAAGRAGVALLLAGIAVYLPLHAVTGRYTIPAVWGVALLVVVVLDALLQPPRRRAAHLGLALIAIGLAAVGIENLVRQDKAIARSAVLWRALELVEAKAPAGAVVAWQAGAANLGEGIHFFWHLRGRGRGDLRPLLLDAAGAPLARRELPPPQGEPTWLVSSDGRPPRAAAWQLVAILTRPYRAGRRIFNCAVFARPSG